MKKNLIYLKKVNEGDEKNKQKKTQLEKRVFLSSEINLFFSECFFSQEIIVFFGNALPKSNARAHLKQRKKNIVA